jgi:scyllo-inositol 2-dehydrogenase (NADP+)
MNKPIKTALASYGMSGAIFHAPFLMADRRFQIVKVLERTKSLSKDKIPNANIVRNFGDLTNDPEIELIVVNTPNQLHFPMTKQALENGKHVIVEKPFTVTVGEAEELVAIAKKKGLVLGVYHSKRFEPDFQTMKKLIDSGSLGNIKLFESHVYRWKPEVGNKLWKVNPGPGSGLLYDLGSHLIDQALVLFGKPKSIFADLGVFRNEAVVDDYFEVIFNYSDKKAILKSFLLSAIEGPRFLVCTDKATYVKQGADVQESLLSKGIMPGSSEWKPAPLGQGGTVHMEYGIANIEPYNIDYREYFANIHNSIRNGSELLVKPEEALEVIRMIELAIKSNEEKRVIEM